MENTRYAETNSVVEMAKSIEPEAADGENVGMVRFGQAAAPALVEILDGIVSSGAVREWAPSAFSRFAGRHPLWAIGTRGFPWIEVDFSEDYERAIAEILPQIDDIPAVGADPVAPPMTAGAASR